LFLAVSVDPKSGIAGRLADLHFNLFRGSYFTKADLVGNYKRG